MARGLTRQLSDSAAWIASSTAWRLRTGKAPGRPRHTGQTLVFGGAPKLVGHPQNIFVRVASWTCTSRPITGSYRATASDVMLHYYNDHHKTMPKSASRMERYLFIWLSHFCGVVLPFPS